jgi:hypothetical protein
MALIKKVTKTSTSFGLATKDSTTPKKTVVYFLGIPVYESVTGPEKSSS